MKKNVFNKLILVVIVTLSVLSTILYMNPTDVATDSGFDSGGSSGGSSSHSSGGSSGSAKGNPTGFTILAIIVTGVIIYTIIKMKKEVKQEMINDQALAEGKDLLVSEEEFEKLIKNETKKEFVKKRYEDYLAIQYAWMDFNYDTLREKTSNELYNQYNMQLETLKQKHQKNIMKDFELVTGALTKLSKENDKIYATVELTVKFYDFIINEDTQKVVKGRQKTRIELEYEMVFVKNINTNAATYCPNCGAKLKDKNTDTCEFCGSKITAGSNEWLLTTKKALSQERTFN